MSDPRGADRRPNKCKQRVRFFAELPETDIVRDEPLQPFITYFNSWMPELGKLSREELPAGTSLIARLFQRALSPGPSARGAPPTSAL